MESLRTKVGSSCASAVTSESSTELTAFRETIHAAREEDRYARSMGLKEQTFAMTATSKANSK